MKISLPGCIIPQHAVESTNNTIFVSHLTNENLGEHACLFAEHYGVSEFSFLGDVLRVFGGLLVQMKRPGYLTTDSAGRILVVDKTNNRILVLDSELRFMRVLLKADEDKGDPTKLEIHQMTLGGSPCRLYVIKWAYGLIVYSILTSDNVSSDRRVQL